MQCTHLRFPGQDLKGTVAYVRRQKMQLFQVTSEICVSCLFRLSASLLSPCTGEQAFGLSPSQYLHTLIVLLGKQLGQHIIVSRKHRIRGMC